MTEEEFRKGGKSKFFGTMTVKVIQTEEIDLHTGGKETLGYLIDTQLRELQANGAKVLSVTVTLPQDDNQAPDNSRSVAS